METPKLSISEKIEKLGELLEEIYSETKIQKFKDDSTLLEQWIWSLSDKKKAELNINLNGSIGIKK